MLWFLKVEAPITLVIESGFDESPPPGSEYSPALYGSFPLLIRFLMCLASRGFGKTLSIVSLKASSSILGRRDLRRRLLSSRHGFVLISISQTD